MAIEYFTRLAFFAGLHLLGRSLGFSMRLTEPSSFLNAMRAFLATLAILTFTTSAISCGCEKPRTPAEARGASIIFRGKVVSIVRNPGQGGGLMNIPSQTVVFDVVKQLSGPQRNRVSVKFNEGGTSCDLEALSFVPGQIFLLSAKLSKRIEESDLLGVELYRNNFCDLRERISPSGGSRRSERSGITTGLNLPFVKIRKRQDLTDLTLEL